MVDIPSLPEAPGTPSGLQRRGRMPVTPPATHGGTCRTAQEPAGSPEEEREKVAQPEVHDALVKTKANDDSSASAAAAGGLGLGEAFAAEQQRRERARLPRGEDAAEAADIERDNDHDADMCAAIAESRRAERAEERYQAEKERAKKRRKLKKHREGMEKAIGNTDPND